MQANYMCFIQTAAVLPLPLLSIIVFSEETISERKVQMVSNEHFINLDDACRVQ